VILNINMKRINDISLLILNHNKTIREVKLWSYAAWSTPFVALFILFFLQIIGWDQWYARALVSGAVIMFSIAVIWWWWAIFKVASISNSLLDTADKLKEVSVELNAINRSLRQKDK